MNRSQYTIRGVPDRLDQLLRERAAREGRSLNAEILDALQRGLGYDGTAVVHHDLDDLAGSWVEDPDFDRAVRDMDRVDEELWK